VTGQVVPVVLMPDAEELVITYLAERFPEPEHRVVAELWQGFEEELPVVRVTRTGGAQTRPLVLDSPLMDVDVYASTRAGASQLMREIAANLLAAKNYPAAGGLITQVDEEVGPSWRPDYNLRVYHFGGQYTVNTRPTA
jgi:hypothetical protein